MTLPSAGTPVLVQGITGRTARRHAPIMRAYGTKLVAGVAPGRGGTSVAGIPVFDSVAAARERTGASVSVAFLPSKAVGEGIVEAADAGVTLMIVVTEGAPLYDVLVGLEAAQRGGMRVIGPNCPGMASIGEYLLGFLPVDEVQSGTTAVLARSGTLSYEAVDAITRAGLGISTWIGVGGDRVKGSTFSDLLPHVLADGRTEALVLIGEIGGSDEQDVAPLLADVEMPAAALLGGSHAPKGVALGHAGAIVEGERGSYIDKRAALEAAGVTVVSRPAQLPGALAERRARGSLPVA